MSDAEAETEEAEETSAGAEGDADAEEFDPERLGELVDVIGEGVGELKQTIVDDEEGGDLVETAEELWEVLDEFEDLLETLDFEELPETIDVEDLPEAVDVEDLPGALFDEDESAIDLTGVQEAVTLRELWDAVDLTSFLQEKRQLESAIDDVTDDEGEDEEDDDLFENVVDTDLDGGFEDTARQAFIEEKVLAAVEKFRSAILSTHDGLRTVYEKNQEKLGESGNQPDSLNPTATSTMPPGPLPDSISTRASTVPPQVRYSRVDNPRRIFGRRFEERRDDEDAADEESGPDTTGAEAGADTEDGGDAAANDDADGTDGGDTTDDDLRIEVFEDDA